MYLYSPEHPNTTKRGYVAEHRMVMENKIGRFLKRSERIDHINHNKLDNRVENLKLYNSASDAARADLEIVKFVKQNFGSLENLKKIMKDNFVITTETLIAFKPPKNA